MCGSLSADGLSGSSGGAGGSSGGSVWITTGAILHYVFYFSYLLLANSVLCDDVVYCICHIFRAQIFLRCWTKWGNSREFNFMIF